MAVSDANPNVESFDDNAPGTLTDDAEGISEELQGGMMSLVDHLEELRRRIFFSLIAVAVCSVVCFIFWDPILRFLLTPLPSVSSKVPGIAQHQLVTHGLGEGFLIALKMAVAVGSVVASPVILYQLWAFIAPALTRKEKKYALPFTALGVVLLAIGMTVGFFVLRYPVEFLVNFGSDRFALLLDADSYFTFIAFFLLAFGIVFETPLVLTFMATVGLVSSKFLRQRRAYILFGLWLVSAFITPGADPYSPVIIGVSFTVLFEFSIILIRLIGK